MGSEHTYAMRVISNVHIVQTRTGLYHMSRTSTDGVERNRTVRAMDVFNAGNDNQQDNELDD